MFDRSAWSHLGAPTRTELVQNLAFSMIARSVGGIHLLIGATFQKYPYKLFRLLDPAVPAQHTAASLARDGPCLWDRFARSVRQAFTSAKDLASSKCLAVLSSIAILLRLDTSRVECRHAWVRKALTLKGQASASEIAAVSADWLLARERVLESMGPGLPTREEPGERRGGGGPCRAFMSEWLAANSAVAASKSELFSIGLSEYRKLKEQGGEEFDAYLEKGATGTQVHHAGGSSFGYVRAPPAAALPPGPPDVPDASDEIDQAWAIVASDASRDSIGGAIQQIVCDQRAVSRAEAAKRQEKASNLQKWRGEAWQRSGQAALSGLAPLWDLASGVKPVPQNSLHASFQWQPPARQLAEHLWGTCSPTLRREMVDDWQQRHEKVDVASLPRLTNAEPEKPTICFIANMCLCRRLTLTRFCDALLSALRARAPPHSALRASISQGSLVLCLQAPSRPTWRRFFYVSYINFTTFCAAVMPLLLDEDLVRCATAAVHQQVALRPREVDGFGTATWWQALADIEEDGGFDTQFQLAFFRLGHSRAYQPDWLPAHVCVELACPYRVLDFWPPPPPQKRAEKKRKKGQAQPLAALGAPELDQVVRFFF